MKQKDISNSETAFDEKNKIALEQLKQEHKARNTVGATYDYSFELDQGEANTISEPEKTIYEKLIEKEKYQQKLKSGQIVPEASQYQNPNRVTFAYTPKEKYLYSKLRKPFDTDLSSETITDHSLPLEDAFKSQSSTTLLKSEEKTKDKNQSKPKEFGA